MVTFSYEWKSLKWDEKPKTSTQTKYSGVIILSIWRKTLLNHQTNWLSLDRWPICACSQFVYVTNARGISNPHHWVRLSGNINHNLHHFVTPFCEKEKLRMQYPSCETMIFRCLCMYKKNQKGTNLRWITLWVEKSICGKKVCQKNRVYKKLVLLKWNCRWDLSACFNLFI